VRERAPHAFRVAPHLGDAVLQADHPHVLIVHDPRVLHRDRAREHERLLRPHARLAAIERRPALRVATERTGAARARRRARAEPGVAVAALDGIEAAVAAEAGARAGRERAARRAAGRAAVVAEQRAVPAGADRGAVAVLGTVEDAVAALAGAAGRDD